MNSDVQPVLGKAIFQRPESVPALACTEWSPPGSEPRRWRTLRNGKADGVRLFKFQACRCVRRSKTTLTSQQVRPSCPSHRLLPAVAGTTSARKASTQTVAWSEAQSPKLAKRQRLNHPQGQQNLSVAFPSQNINNRERFHRARAASLSKVTESHSSQAPPNKRCHPGSFARLVLLFLAQPHDDVQVPHYFSNLMYNILPYFLMLIVFHIS